jgi:Flp pilus assembly protein CpaB
VVVFAGLSAVTRTGNEDMVTVVVTSRLVAAGSTVTANDVTLTSMPLQAVPDGALSRDEDAIGKVAGTGIRTGQILTDLTLVGGASSDGSVVLSVRLDNPELAALAPPGTRVTLFATTSAEPVASHVLVVAIPAVENGGILSSAASKVLLVRVTPDEASRITRALASSTLTLAIG